MKIGNLDISAKVGVNDCSIYLGNVKLYPNEGPQPVGDCYSVISTPISDYTSTDYDSVFSYSDLKWYMKNNLNQYEEYGIYETASTLSELTYYDGKLAFIGETEYQYQTNEWVEVGEYIETDVTYEITEDSSALYGTEIPTAFKIPTADVESALESSSMDIYAQNGSLYIGMYDYRFFGDNIYNGTVTNDDEYYYYSLPSEAPQSIVIDNIGYYNQDTIHLIVSSKQAEVEYATKDKPLAEIFNTVADMKAVGCPTVGVGQYGIVGNNAYQYGSNNQWSIDNTTKLIATYSNGKGLVVDCNTSNTLTSGETQPSYLTATAMTNAVIGECVTNINERAFSGCTSLANINIPDSVTSIGEFTFLYCESLTSITIPDSVTSIGGSAFQSCSSLASVTIPDSVTSINYGIFYDCTSLTSITIPDSVTSIGRDAFNDTPWWTSYSADTNNHYGNIIYINDVAYKATATSITSVTFKENTVSIGGGAFYDCTSLASVTIPDSVASIGNNAFYNCRSLTSITIPNSVTSIGGSAFSRCNGLTNITIGNGVESIDSYVFQYCSSLTSITIPDSVTSIGGSAFQSCSSLASVTIPDSVTSIGNWAFGNCSGLTSVTIGNGVTSIGNWAFGNCSGLTSITINAETPPTLGANVFNNTNNCPIYVPSASVDTYKAASGWSAYASRIQAIP